MLIRYMVVRTCYHGRLYKAGEYVELPKGTVVPEPFIAVGICNDDETKPKETVIKKPENVIEQSKTVTEQQKTDIEETAAEEQSAQEVDLMDVEVLEKMNYMVLCKHARNRGIKLSKGVSKEEVIAEMIQYNSLLQSAQEQGVELPDNPTKEELIAAISGE